MVGVDMALDPTMEQGGQDPGTGRTTICQVHTGDREISSHLTIFHVSVEEKAKISGKEVLINSSYVQVVELLYRDLMYTMPAAHDETLQAKRISGNHG